MQNTMVKNIFIQEKLTLRLTFNPTLELTSFRTTQPWILRACLAKILYLESLTQEPVI